MKKLMLCCFFLTALFLTSCSDDEKLLGTESVDQAAQDVEYSERTCNSTDHQHSLMNDSHYKSSYDKRVQKLSTLAQTRSVEDCTEPIVLAVAVHFQNISNPDQACLRALAQTQIDILNADYQAQNSDVSNFDAVAGNYPGVVPTDACVKFCLADQNHPSGSGIANGTVAVTFNTVSGDNAPAWADYINIFVRPNLGFLGYSPLGGAGNGDGVVIDAGAFASGTGCGQVSPQAPYDLGRTLTHELGHYLLLDHLWGNGGCGSDDGISDTPSQTDSNYGCPSANTSSCGSIDLHMSYMDYTNDECMYMFSNQQASTMNNYVTANFQSLITKAQTVCSANEGDGNGDNDSDGNDDNEGDGNDDNEGDGNGDDEGDGNGDDEGDDEGDDQGDDEGDDQDPNGCNGYEITLSLTFDDYPEETRWVIKNVDTGERMAFGKNYDESFIGQTIQEDICLPDGCYKLVVRDSYGDGICCNYGDGTFSILDEDGSEFFYSDGNFGNRERVDFCIDSGQYRKGSSEKDAKATNLVQKAQRTVDK